MPYDWWKGGRVSIVRLSLVLCLTVVFALLEPVGSVSAQTATPTANNSNNSQTNNTTGTSNNTTGTNATNNQPNNTNQPGNQSGQECDWSEYKASLSGTESGGKYTVVNGICATGKYQFMPSTGKGLDSFKQADPMCRSFT